MVPADPDDALAARMLASIFDSYVAEPMREVVAEALRAPERQDPLPVSESKARLDKSYAWLYARIGASWATLQWRGWSMKRDRIVRSFRSVRRSGTELAGGRIAGQSNVWLVSWLKSAGRCAGVVQTGHRACGACTITCKSTTAEAIRFRRGIRITGECHFWTANLTYGGPCA